MATPESEKTQRIGWLCITMAFLGILFFLNKSNACALACNSCNQHETAPSVCKDEFHEIKDGYRNDFNCTAGAKAELVASPPAPKPGIMCHCTNKDQAAPATPVPVK